MVTKAETVQNSFLYIVLILVFFCCSSPKRSLETDQDASPSSAIGSDTSEYAILVTILDNSLKLWVDDSLVYESKAMSGNLKEDLLVDFSPYIKTRTETVRLELFNGYEPYDQMDKHWEIRYDLIIQKELADFVHESSRNGELGKVFEMSYKIDEWTYED